MIKNFFMVIYWVALKVSENCSKVIENSSKSIKKKKNNFKKTTILKIQNPQDNVAQQGSELE